MSIPFATARVAAALTLGLSLGAASARAQSINHNVAISDAAACLSSRSADRWPARPIFVSAALADTFHTAYLSNTRALAELVAEMARRAYVDGGDSLSAGEPTFTWRATGAELEVQAHRDGRFTWASRDTTLSDADAAGVEVVRQAFAALVASQQSLRWPAGLADDSVAIAFRFAAAPKEPPRREDLLAIVQSERPVFALRMPPFEPPQDQGGPMPVYPQMNRETSVTGRLRLQFVVDSLGRVARSTIRSLDADDEADIPAMYRGAYVAFLRSVRDAVPRHRYAPATIDGCRVATKVSQEFRFDLR